MRSVGAAGAVVVSTGVASASDGRTRYVARATGDPTDAVTAAGFEVLRELAGGDVLLVTGPEDAADELSSVDGVGIAVPDVDVELEDPVLEIDEATAAADGMYEEFLWDKQIQQVREAHDHATGAGRTVAVLDTGVDDTHPDLEVDVERSVAMVDGQPVEHAGDLDGHGTHVAGTVAGTGDGGMLGTAPDATIVSVRILYGDSGAWGDILAGMEYAAEIGADAANMSVGTAAIPPQENALQYRQLMESVAQHVTRTGTVIVGSAGNGTANLQQGGTFTLPNSLSGVVSVSSTGPNDLRSYFSNYGTNEIDVGAPGGGYEEWVKTVCGYREWYLAGRPDPAEDPREEGDDALILLDEAGNLVLDRDEADEVIECSMPAHPYPFNLVYSTIPDGYGWKAGTSMAAPQVTGLAALVRELEPETTARQVTTAIKHGTDGAAGRSDGEVGAGRTNALKTVERLL